MSDVRHRITPGQRMMRAIIDRDVKAFTRQWEKLRTEFVQTSTIDPERTVEYMRRTYSALQMLQPMIDVQDIDMIVAIQDARLEVAGDIERLSKGLGMGHLEMPRA